MAKPLPPPTSGDVFVVLIGGPGLALGFGMVAEDRNLAAVLSMSGLCGDNAVTHLFEEIPSQQQVVKEASEAGKRRQLWGKWFIVGTEKQVVNLTDKDVGVAVMFILWKSLHIHMPVSIAATVHHSHHRLQQPGAPLGLGDAPS